MILEIPVIYPGYATPVGKRSFETAHLVARVAVEIREIDRSELRLAARATVDNTLSPGFKLKPPGTPKTTTYEYFGVDGALVAPLRLSAHDSVVNDPPVPVGVEDLPGMLPGADRLQFLRGDPLDLGTWSYDRFVMTDGRPRTPKAHYTLRNINPFLPPSVVEHLGHHSKVESLVSEGSPRLRRAQEAYPGARQEAVGHARRIAAGCVLVDGQVMAPNVGPLWRFMNHGTVDNQTAVMHVVPDEGVLPQFGDSRWGQIFRGDDFDAATVSAAFSHWGRDNLDVPLPVKVRGGIEVLDPSVFQADIAERRILSRIRTGPLHVEGVNRELLAMPAHAIAAWVALRDAVAALPPGVGADGPVLEAAAAAVAAGLPHTRSLASEVILAAPPSLSAAPRP